KLALMKADPACFRAACLALAALDLSPVLKNIESQTLVMAGSEDATTPPALARERRRRGRIFASCHDKGLTLDVLQYWGQIKGSEREAGGAETRRIGFHQSQL